MATAYRSDFWGFYFMPETTPGTNPGICAASDVDGAAESYKYQPQVAIVDGHGAGGARRAFVRLAEAPSGLPKQALVDIPQVWQTNDYDFCKAPGLRSDGEISLTMNIAGCVLDSGSAADTYRPSPHPWLRLAGSSLGKLVGYRSTQKGGDADTVAAAPTSGEDFDVTTGALYEGHVFGVKVSGSTYGANTYEIIRPTDVDSDTSLDAATYNGGVFGLSATPTAGDVVNYSVQAHFDKREEANAETFTFLFVRPIANATMIVKGARCSGWEITSETGKIPQIKMTFIFESWAVYGSHPSEFDAAPPALAEEPAYYTDWPCPIITADAKFVYQLPHATPASRTAVRTMDISSMKVKWTAGYARRMAVTGTQGVADILASQKSSLEVTFTSLYSTDWRSFIGACCAGTVQETFPIAYWENNEAQRIWFLFVASAYLLEDPGFDGSWENNMSQEIKLGVRKYVDDDGDYSAGSTLDSKFCIGQF